MPKVHAEDMGNSNPKSNILKKIKWNQVKGAIGYKVIIYKDSSQSQVIKEIELENTFYELQLNDYRNLFWKIAAYDEDGELGEWSSLQTLEALSPVLEKSKEVIVKKKPKKIEKPVVTKAPPSMKKTLTPISSKKSQKIRLLAGAKSFKIQQAASNETTDILSKEASGTSLLGLKIDYEYNPKLPIFGVYRREENFRV